MVELLLKRKENTPYNTLGELSFKNFIQTWKTLEDVDRDYNQDGDLNEAGETKVWGQTAIPCGTYWVKFKESPHFKRMMPYIEGVKTHSSVMIHSGTTEFDTNGCPLIGTTVETVQGKYELRQSKKAFAQFIDILAPQLGYKIVWQDRDKLQYTLERFDEKADEEAVLRVTNEGRKKRE